MMPGLPVASIQQFKYNRHDGLCLELFPGLCRFEPSFLEAHRALKTIFNIRSHKLRIKTGSFLEEIINLGQEVFKDIQSDMAVRLGMLRDTT
jgi:hypothetical protein